MSLRSETIRLAYTNPELRPHLLDVLSKQAGSYQEYVKRKEREHEKPMGQDAWEARTQGAKGDTEPSESEPKSKSDSPPEEAGAPKSEEPKEKSEEPKAKVPSKLQSLFSGIKGITSTMVNSIAKAPAKVHSFVTDKDSRNETLKSVAASVKESPKKVSDSVWAGAKKEVHELKHAGKALRKALKKPRQEWDREDKKAVYGAAIYVVSAVMAASGGGPVMAAGALGKSFAVHVATKAMHHVLDTGFTHFEAGEAGLHGAEHLLHLVEHLHLAADEEEADQRLLMDHLTVAVGAVLNKGVSDDEMKSILKGGAEPSMGDFGQPKEAKSPKGKEAALRAAVIRLAHTNPTLRPHLLPILASSRVADMHVAVKDLPQSVQRALKSVGYGRRDIRVEARPSISIQGAGGDGFREFAVILNLETGHSETLKGSWGGANPWNPRNQVDMDERQHTIPMNGAVIKGTEGGNRPVYAVLYVNPDNMAALLPAPVDLTPQEDWALAIISGLKPSYRGEYFERRDLGAYNVQNPFVQSLIAKGLVQATGSGIQITTAGKNAVNPRLRP